MSIRPVRQILESTPAVEGAGVKLRRAFGFGDTGDFDPFLLFDDFRNDRPEDYLAGFPWHPHRRTLPVETTRHAFAYVFEGSGTFRDASDPRAPLTEDTDGRDVVRRDDTGNRSLVLFDRGDEVVVQAGEQGIRFLLVSGQPIEEPVAWYGPIVMNTKHELQQALAELRNGTFIR